MCSPYIITNAEMQTLMSWQQFKDQTILYGTAYPKDKPVCLTSTSIKVKYRWRNHGQLLSIKSLRVAIPKTFGIDEQYYQDGWPYIIAEDKSQQWCFVKNGEVVIKDVPLNFPKNKLTLIPLNQFERNITNEELLEHGKTIYYKFQKKHDVSKSV